jgi:hypothetical protein
VFAAAVYFCREVRRMRVLSADSHTVEPGDLWTSRLDRKFRDSAPHIEMRGSTALLFAPGIRPFAVGGISASGKSGEDLAKHWKTGYEAVRPSGWDPAERLKDQDVDGVEGEVLYTSLGLPLFALPDLELQQACFSAYHDWLSEGGDGVTRSSRGCVVVPLWNATGVYTRDEDGPCS